jgi:hypothetical protein
MAFRNVQVPAAAETANRNPIVDSWNKSHDNAVHSFVQAITNVAGRPGSLSARLDRHPIGAWARRAQSRDRAGPPVRANHDPDLLLEMPLTLFVEEGNSKPLLYGTTSKSRAPAALCPGEALR